MPKGRRRISAAGWWGDEFICLVSSTEHCYVLGSALCSGGEDGMTVLACFPARSGLVEAAVSQTVLASLTCALLGGMCGALGPQIRYEE